MEIHVILGFMDEEVASMLSYIAVNEKDYFNNITVVERSLIKDQEGARLFERPLESYIKDLGDPEFKYFEFEELFEAKNQGRENGLSFSTYLKDRLGRRADPNEVLKFSYSVFSQLRFELNADSEQELWIIRAPEMGKQPALVRMYIRLILRYFFGKDKDINVFSYAAGGGIIPGSNPGRLHNIKGSAFIGPDIDSSGGPFPNVELIYQSESSPIRFHRTGALAKADSQSIDTVAEDFFLGNRTVALIRGHLARQVEMLKNSVSATFSFFDGSDTKKAVDATYNNMIRTRSRRQCTSLEYDDWKESDFEGLQPLSREKNIGGLEGTNFFMNSNMEDYHILRVLHAMTQSDEDRARRNYPKLNSYGIVRVDSNVQASEILENGVKAFIEKDLFKEMLTKRGYKALTSWGDLGTPITEVQMQTLKEDAGEWTVHWHNTFVKNGIELAALIKELIIFEFQDGILKQVTEIASNTDNWYCLHPFCVEIATDFPRKLLETLSDDNSYHIWIRGRNKWKGIERSGFLGEEGLSEAKVIDRLEMGTNIDRILYKSSGAAALQANVAEAFEIFNATVSR